MDIAFDALATWSSAQRQIQEAFVTNPTTLVTLPHNHGASTVLAGLAIAQAMCGDHVLIVEPDSHTCTGIMGTLESLCKATTVRSTQYIGHLEKRWNGSRHCMLQNKPTHFINQ